MSYPLLTSFNNTIDIQDISKNQPLVIEIQTLLNLGNFYSGNIDGLWGDKTDVAFKAFKKAAYLEHPDLLGRSTADALLEITGKGTHPSIKDGGYSGESYREDLKLPGGRIIKIGDLIPGSYSFKWSEATARGTRKPSESAVVTRIIHLAQYLDRVKSLLNNRPIHVSSWYRPPDVNRAVGGVKNSIHLLGSAVDFTVEGIPPLEVYRQLNGWHGRVGGLGRSSAFTHLDLRGYPARWNYGA